MTLLEAMSLGKPCVVTDAGGNPEIVKDKFNGLVAINNDSSSFYKAITVIANGVDTRRIMSTQSKNIFNESFTSAIMANRYHNLYKSVISFLE